MQNTQANQNFHTIKNKTTLINNKIPKFSHFTNSEKEALQVFNQVTSNKNQIFEKDSKAFYLKKTIKFLKYDSNGNQYFEKYDAVSFGGFTAAGESLAEVLQKYENEKTGTEKSSLHRILGKKSRKYEVRKTEDSRSTDDYSEDYDLESDDMWKSRAKDLGLKNVISFQNKVCSALSGL